MVHKNMLSSAAFWMLHFWRTEPLDERDFEWFEDEVPRLVRRVRRRLGGVPRRRGTTRSSSSTC